MSYGYSVTIRIDESLAPDAETAARAAHEDLHQMIEQDVPIIMEVTFTDETGDSETTLWHTDWDGADRYPTPNPGSA